MRIVFLLEKGTADWVLPMKIELQMQVVGSQSEPSISNETKHKGKSRLKVRMNIFKIYYIVCPECK